mmetsp:Transcript_11382/g.26773  ORF Transcript_11382/g.26773 Transcript_11382/m.26773 type:complete len:193 (+) Transcript_11382:80-658(+)
MNTTTSFQDNLAHENGGFVNSKGSKFRRLPFSPRQDNIRVVSKTSTSKPNKPIVSLRPIKNGVQKISVRNETEENMGDWNSSIPAMPKGSTHETTSKTLPLEEDRSESSTCRSELCCDERSSIFREMIHCEDRDDMMVLKRATPLYDSEDDEDHEEIPVKKLRTTGEASVLQWGERLEESSEGFSLTGYLRE